MVIQKTLRDLCLADQRVLVRADFNVLDEYGNLVDDYRLRATLPTIRYLIKSRAKVILMSHCGRPAGKIVKHLRLDRIAERLSTLLHTPVHKLDDCIGATIEETVTATKPGDVTLLENLRFHAEEELNDPGFAQALAKLGDVYVNDAFGTAHRQHASTVAVVKFLKPASIGLLMEQELKILSQLLTSPDCPFVTVLGGAKVFDKINVIDNLLDKNVNAILIGGAMAHAFMSAKNFELGASLLDTQAVSPARELLETARAHNVEIILPKDLVVSKNNLEDVATHVVSSDQIPASYMSLDIGPRTAAQFGKIIARANTVFWNGPMGQFEHQAFANGTQTVADAIAKCNGTTVVGGGETVDALTDLGVLGKVTHASTGGGAALEFLAGRSLPGIQALNIG